MRELQLEDSEKAKGCLSERKIQVRGSDVEEGLLGAPRCEQRARSKWGESPFPEGLPLGSGKAQAPDTP